MSIGIWDVPENQSGVIFTTEQAPLVVPCNTGCFLNPEDLVDGFIPAVSIPPNFTDPTPQLLFEVPNYFLDNNGFDLAVSVRSGLPSEGGELISVVYFKNVSFVNIAISPVDVPDIAAPVAGIIESLLGTSAGVGVFIIAAIITLIFTVVASRTAGVLGGGATFITLLATFTFIGWIDSVVFILLSLVAAFIVGRMLTSDQGG